MAKDRIEIRHERHLDGNPWFRVRIWMRGFVRAGLAKQEGQILMANFHTRSSAI